MFPTFYAHVVLHSHRMNDKIWSFWDYFSPKIVTLVHKVTSFFL